MSELQGNAIYTAPGDKVRRSRGYIHAADWDKFAPCLGGLGADKASLWGKAALQWRRSHTAAELPSCRAAELRFGLEVLFYPTSQGTVCLQTKMCWCIVTHFSYILALCIPKRLHLLIYLIPCQGSTKIQKYLEFKFQNIYLPQWKIAKILVY